MRVLHYTPGIDHASGGVATYMQLLARDLGSLCELHVVTHHAPGELPLQNCSVSYLPNRWWPWRNCRRELTSLLEQLRPDVVHVNSCWLPGSALVALWSKRLGYKVIYTPHGMLEPWCMARHRWKKFPALWLYQRRGLEVSDVIHATSEMEREHLLQLGWNPRVEVVANCVQLDQIPLKQSWQRRRTLLFFSRIHPKKGIPLLLDAVAQLREELRGYTLRIVGPGEPAYLTELQAMAEAKGIAQIVRFEPPVYGDQKWQLYHEADVMVLPTYSENFGLVIAESLACGTPVITTEGTPWQELNTQHCGWWIPLSLSSLVNALRDAIRCDESTLRTMGLNGRSLIARQYDSPAVAQQMMEVYRLAINS